MKRFTLLITGILVSLFCAAQNGHMKFMGIPLDGTINSFQSKLASKGIQPNVEFNRNIAPGSRAFTGMFAGYKAQIFVYYNNKTKTVYRAKACITNTNKAIAEQTYRILKSQLEEKYNYGLKQPGFKYGFESLAIFTSIGQVQLEIAVYTGSPTTYGVMVDYYDEINYEKNYNSVKDDL